MERHHRQIIFKNLDKLVKDSNLDSVCNTLLRKGVFNTRMVEPFQNELRTPTERKKEMYLYLETRGPEAFSKLIETLIETGHFILARTLDPTCDPETYLIAFRAQQSGSDDESSPHEEDVNDTTTNTGRCHPFILPHYMVNDNPNQDIPITLERASRINVGTEPHPIKVKPATARLDQSSHPDLLVYPMGSYPKGLVLIINNVEFRDPMYPRRQGAQVDESNLTSLFRQLGFKVLTPLQNLGSRDMENEIEEFAKHPDLKHAPSMFLIVMSHGEGGHQNNSQIIGSDGLPLDTAWIIEQFNNINCKDMAGKPKIFIFQACEGRQMAFLVQRLNGNGQRTQIDGTLINNINIRTVSDILVAHATVPGYISHRDKFLGTWFIQAICEIFMDNARNHHIEEMLKMVDNRLAHLISEVGSVQTSCYRSVGFQLFYMNPGLYDEGVEIVDWTETMDTTFVDGEAKTVLEESTEDTMEVTSIMANGNSPSNGL